MSDGDAPSLPPWAVARLPNGKLACRVAEGRGIGVDLFAARLLAGWSPERAVYEPRPRVRERAKPRPSLLREVRLSDGRLAWPVAAAAGISEATFRARLSRGLSPDRAALDPVASPAERARPQWQCGRSSRPLSRPLGRPSALRGLRLPDGRSALAVAAAGGVSVATFRARLRRGWSVERAALEPVATSADCVRAMGAARSVRRNGAAAAPAAGG